MTLKSITNKHEKNIIEVLETVANEGYTNIMVFAYKGGKINIHSSGCEDLTRTVGALEIIKNELLNPPEDSE